MKKSAYKRALCALFSAFLVLTMVFPGEVALAASAPGNVARFSMTGCSASTVSLSWSKVKGASGYRIRRYDSKSKKWKTVLTANKGSAIKGTVKKLSPATTYKLQIHAYKKAGKKTLYSKKAKTLTVATKPAKVTLQSVKASGAKITVSWKKGAASGYQVIYARNMQFKNGESILVGGSNKTATYYAPYSGTYYVHLRPYKNLNGKKYYGSWSNTKTVKVNIPKQAYHTETVWAKRGKNRIYGQVYVPDGVGYHRPTVILSHSFGLTYKSMNAYCAMLAKNGYVAYCFDFCGGSKKSKSDGKTTDMTVFTEVKDLESVLSKARALKRVDKNKIFLLGTSQGGLVSALTASKNSSKVRGLILMYPGLNMADEMTKNYKGHVPKTANFLVMTVGHDYISTLIDYDIYGNIKNFKKDVIIIHGTADSRVPIRYSEKAVKTYKSATLYRIQGANRGFNRENYAMGKNYDNKVNPLILSYLKNHI